MDYERNCPTCGCTVKYTNRYNLKNAENPRFLAKEEIRKQRRENRQKRQKMKELGQPRMSSLDRMRRREERKEQRLERQRVKRRFDRDNQKRPLL